MSDNLLKQRQDVNMQLRRAGHLHGGWYHLDGGGWGCKCAQCGHVVHITPNGIYGLCSLRVCVPDQYALNWWRLYNVCRAGLVVDRCFHSSLPCSDPWIVVFSDGSYLNLSNKPWQSNGLQWGQEFEEGSDDRKISFTELPEDVRDFVLINTTQMCENPLASLLRSLRDGKIPKR